MYIYTAFYIICCYILLFQLTILCVHAVIRVAIEDDAASVFLDAGALVGQVWLVVPGERNTLQSP